MDTTASATADSVCHDGRRRRPPGVAGRRPPVHRSPLGGAGVRGFAINVAVTAIAFFVLTKLYSQIKFDGTVVQLVLLAVVFGLVNAFIKPVIKLLSFPITAMTLGLFALVINGALLLFVAWLSDNFLKIDFSVGGFPHSGLSIDAFVAAIVGSIVLSVISAAIGLVVHD